LGGGGRGKSKKLSICTCIGHSIKTSVCNFCVDENLKNVKKEIKQLVAAGCLPCNLTPHLLLPQNSARTHPTSLQPIDVLIDVWGKR
jgi:hypothetical protein